MYNEEVKYNLEGDFAGMSMIVWRLREVMDKKGIRADELAGEVGVKPNAVTRWRKSDMPALNGDRLTKIVMAINKLSKKGGTVITINNLISWQWSDRELGELGVDLGVPLEDVRND